MREDDLGHLLDDWSAQFAQLAGEPLSGMLQAYRGVAVLPAAVAAELGASGPVARASGIDADLRRDRADRAGRMRAPAGPTVRRDQASDGRCQGGIRR